MQVISFFSGITCFFFVYMLYFFVFFDSILCLCINVFLETLGFVDCFLSKILGFLIYFDS